MKRLLTGALALACACSAHEYDPSEVEISAHRREVYTLARDYIVSTFNLEVREEGVFNPVRLNSHGVWGDFEARLKELGSDRFEVQGWLRARGHPEKSLRWSVHLRYRILDPEGWRYRKVDELVTNDPEFLGWRFGMFSSVAYKVEYDPLFVARTFD